MARLAQAATILTLTFCAALLAIELVAPIAASSPSNYPAIALQLVVTIAFFRAVILLYAEFTATLYAPVADAATVATSL